MKNLFYFIFLFLLPIESFGQVPNLFNYQAIVRSTSGEPIISQLVSFKFSIIKSEASGTAVYIENHTTTTNEFGLVNLIIGDGTDKTGDFNTIDWGSNKYFLKTEVDPAGGSDYTDMGTAQLISVPYAMYSKVSETATNAVTKEYIDDLMKLSGLFPDNFSGIIKDIEGNIYKTVQIGSQVWMAENLKTTKFINGDNITTGIHTQGEANIPIYGLLYTWHVTNDSRGVCPTDWHVPSEAEWNVLLSNVTSPAELKESGTAHWFAPNTGATNLVSFTALPGGYYGGSGPVSTGIQAMGSFWFSDQTDETHGRGFMLYYNNSPTTGDIVAYLKNCAFSVRCLKD